MKNKLFYTVSGILLTLIIGCIPMNISNVSTGNNKNINSISAGQPPSHPYYGKIDISLDTSLISYSGGKLGSKPRKFILNDNPETTTDFKIESLHLSEIQYIHVEAINS